MRNLTVSQCEIVPNDRASVRIIPNHIIIMHNTNAIAAIAGDINT